MDAMHERARNAGVAAMIITGGSLKESKHALSAAKKYSASTYCTTRRLTALMII